MSLWFERLYPYILMGVAAFLWCRLQISFPVSESVLSSTLSVAGIFVGFLATSKAILMSMTSSIIERLRESGYMGVLASYIGQAIWLNLIFCIVNIVGYFENQKAAWFSVLWIVFAVGAFASFARVTTVMLKIFKYH
ncbi:hypothetical protein [Pseudomonas sp. BMW13]|uniref:hypothetical protein n=1 Tax=Pseudomonas sp. BMW13 TaxID=2562590 RepID=UPI001582775D|nr:hypothetical protein [Pseudomonas sp. BMW13]